MRLPTRLLALCLIASPLAAQAESESYLQRMRKSGEVQELTLRQALELALTRNLDLAVQGYNFELNRLQLKGALGAFDPVVTFSSSFNSSTVPTANITQGGSGDLATSIPRLNTRLSTFAPGIRQNILGGGSLTASFMNNRSTTDNILNFVNPQYGTLLNVAFTQPLLRGFLGGDATIRQIRVIRLNQKLTESQFEQRVAESVQQVHNAYWILTLALETYEVARQSRDLARSLQSITAQKVQSGLLAPLALTSAKSEVSFREQEMIQNEVQIVNAENSLRQLLSPDPGDAIWNRTLIPVDRPNMQSVDQTLQSAIDTAMARRPEITQIGIQLEVNSVDRKFLKSQSMPEVNLSAGVGSTGAAGTIFNPNTGLPLTSNPAFGAYPVSWRQVGSFTFPSWNVGVNVQLPIGNRTLEANHAQAIVAQQRLQTQKKATAQAVIVDVRNAYQGVQLQTKAVDSARLNRELAEEQLRSAGARFESGFSTNFEMLRYQRDLSDARTRELQAQIYYQLAVTALQKAMNTIASANDIVVAKSSVGAVSAP